MFSEEEIEIAKQTGSTLLACETYRSLHCIKHNDISNWHIGLANTYSLYLHTLNPVLYEWGYMSMGKLCIRLDCSKEFTRVFLAVPKEGRKRYLFTCSSKMSFVTILALMATLAVKYKSYIKF